MSDSGHNANCRGRKIPMQVLSLGMPRSGTTSMEAALNILGCGPTYHDFTLFAHLEHCRKWSRALQAKYHPESYLTLFTKSDWDDFLGDYGSLTGTPSVCFAEELINMYPDAKIVLVERDIEDWYNSFSQGAISLFTMPINRLLITLDPPMAPLYKMWTYVFLDPKGFFRSGTKAELENNARSVYREHYAFVRKITPKERLLEYKLESGWEPLCAFLGKELPNVPFPRLNEGVEVRRRSWVLQVQALKYVVRNAAIVGATVAIGMLAVGCALG